MAAFGDDPELVATFRTEVEQRLAALTRGLQSLEGSEHQRDILTALSRDAHTVKGSARMLGLDEVVSLAHGAEDLLAALRDGRLVPQHDHVELLLSVFDAIGAALPGDSRAVAGRTTVLLAALDGALARRGAPARVGAGSGGRGLPDGPTPLDPPAGTVPTLATFVAPGLRDVPAPAAAQPAAAQPAPAQAPAAAQLAAPSMAGSQAAAPPSRVQGSEEVRVNGRRVRAILDAVGEAELGGRRLVRCAQESAGLAAQLAAAVGLLRRSAPALSPEAAFAAQRLTAVSDQLLASVSVTRELAEDHRDRLGQVRGEAIGLAMVPVRHLLSGFPRLVRALARDSGKEVRVSLFGEDVELDKQVLDAVADALTHLVTNAVDHGVEPAAERAAAGKPPAATIGIRVQSAGGRVSIAVSDDGRGVDIAAVREAADRQGLPAEADPLGLLFAPALSTATSVSRVSGRGMGLDAVRAAVESIGGTVAVSTEAGLGTTFTVTVPVTLGVLHCLNVRIGSERYAVPVAAVVETLSLRDCPEQELGGARVLVRAGQTLPLIDLGAVLGVPGAREAASALVTRYAGHGPAAWAVQAVDGESEMVIADLGPFLGGRVRGVSGATIDADGRIVCVLDLREIVPLDPAPLPAGAGAGHVPGQPAELPPARVLVVEDSVGVRELERSILEGAGYTVDTAVDGSDGAARLAGPPPDLVVTDVEMPGLDGFALTRAVRANPDWAQVPVVIVTSCGSNEDKREGVRAGASAYLLKSEFDQQELLETVRRLVGR